MLAFLSPQRQAQILQSISLEPLTSKTITSIEMLRQELEKAREQGFAVSYGEWIEDAAGVAAPILDQEGEVVAALSISGPIQRFKDENVTTYCDEVRRVAARISESMGFARQLEHRNLPGACKMIIQDRIAAQLPAWRERVQRLIKDYGQLKVGDVTVEQIYSGIRGVQINVSDISYIDPQEGIRIRGYYDPGTGRKTAQGEELKLSAGRWDLLPVDGR